MIKIEILLRADPRVILFLKVRELVAVLLVKKILSFVRNCLHLEKMMTVSF